MLPKNWKYLLFLACIFVLFLLVQSSAPQRVDWTASYTKTDKRPYGTYLVHKLLPQIFPKANIQSSYQSIYQRLMYGYKGKEVYLFINNTFEPHSTDLTALLQFAEAGGKVLVAAESFSAEMMDTLGFSVDFRFEAPQMPDSSSLNLTKPALKAQKNYRYKKNSVASYFAVLDSSRSSVLGINQYEEATFVRIGYGQGYFLLNCNPLAFTNYNLLARNNAEYMAKCFAYLPIEEVIWDEYYKVGKVSEEKRGIFGVMQSFEALRWALWLSLAALIFYVLFFTKRRQQIIPTLQSYDNTSLEFAETMGRLYLEHKDNHALALKMLHNLQVFIKKQYLMSLQWPEMEEASVRLLAEKSNHPEQDIQHLADTAKYLQKNTSFSDERLLKLYQIIHSFTQKPT